MSDLKMFSLFRSIGLNYKQFRPIGQYRAKFIERAERWRVSAVAAELGQR